LVWFDLGFVGVWGLVWFGPGLCLGFGFGFGFGFGWLAGWLVGWLFGWFTVGGSLSVPSLRI